MRRVGRWGCKTGDSQRRRRAWRALARLSPGSGSWGSGGLRDCEDEELPPVTTIILSSSPEACPSMNASGGHPSVDTLSSWALLLSLLSPASMKDISDMSPPEVPHRRPTMGEWRENQKFENLVQACPRCMAERKTRMNNFNFLTVWNERASEKLPKRWR